MEPIGEINEDHLNRKPDWKKLGWFLSFSFGLSWITALVMYLSGMKLGEGWSTVLVALFYMAAPALSVLITQKLIYKGSVSQYGWRWKGTNWKAIFISLLIPVFFISLSLLFISLLGNQAGMDVFGRVDLSEKGLLDKIGEAIQSQMPGEAGEKATQNLFENGFPLSPVALLVIIFLVAVPAAFTINLPFMFGEEFGWRGLMLYELQPLGLLKSNLISGIIWGLWHAPLILMGHNYPGEPVWGVVMMTLFTVAASFLFSWARLRSHSILGPCLMHGMINGSAGVMLFVHGGSPLFGNIAGLAGIMAVGVTVLLLHIFDRFYVRNFPQLY